MDASMILASYLFKAQARSGRDSAESVESATRNAKRVIVRLAGAVAVVGTLALAVSLPA